jgi:cation-transporting P-type ATPase E
MGNVTVLCVDKTGTLTRNLLTVQQVIPLGGRDDAAAKELLAQYVGGLHSQNKTAGAIGVFAGSPALSRAVTYEMAFSSARKWSGLTFAESTGTPDDDNPGCRTLLLGSPEILFGQEEAGVLAQATDFTRQGLRVVALAGTEETLPFDDADAKIENPKPKIPLALVVIRDEIRPDINETLRAFDEQGVRVKVISGDNAETVEAIATRSGLRVGRVVTERELADLAPAAFDAAVREANLFARITPDTKRKIVAALTAQGEYVAMVGDGVNDVPAIKMARLGVAMNDGAQITKDVSEIVLLQNTMSTLPRALQEGQTITQKIYTSAKLYLAKNVITIFAILFAGFVNLPFPGEPRMISWIATITVGLPCMFLAFGLLKPAYTRSFLGNVLGYSVLVGAIGAVVVVVAYIVSHGTTQDLRHARTVFALANLHYAIHVFWDVHDVSVFSLVGMRKHPRETLAGLGLLIVGFAAPPLLPGIFSAMPPAPEQWLLIVLLPLAGSYALRNFTYGPFMRAMVKTLRS